MFGISEQEEYGFYEDVLRLANRCKNGKENALVALLQLRERAKELIAQHDVAIKAFHEAPIQ